MDINIIQKKVINKTIFFYTSIVLLIFPIILFIYLKLPLFPIICITVGLYIGDILYHFHFSKLYIISDQLVLIYRFKLIQLPLTALNISFINCNNHFNIEMNNHKYTFYYSFKNYETIKKLFDLVSNSDHLIKRLDKEIERRMIGPF